MKDKVLESEIRKHAEAIASALRKYSDAPMYIHVTVFSRDVDVSEDDIPDYCSVNCHYYDESGNLMPIINQSYLLHYGDDGITKTTPFPYERGNDNDSPN